MILVNFQVKFSLIFIFNEKLKFNEIHFEIPL
jgi:hypothetical protein